MHRASGIRLDLVNDECRTIELVLIVLDEVDLVGEDLEMCLGLCFSPSQNIGLLGRIYVLLVRI